MKSWLIAFSLAQLLDGSTTCIGLNKGYTEVNPFFKSCKSVVLSKAIITPLVIITFKKESKKKKIFLGIVTMATYSAVTWNIYQLRKK